MTEPLIQRMTKRLPKFADQREDRLTEITAGLIQHDAGFAQRFVAALLGPEIGHGWTVDLVRTQLPIKGRIVDLELKLSRGSERCLVWVEVKLGAPETNAQLAAYRERISEYAGGGQHRLVLLLPESKREEFAHAPVDPVVTWEDLVERLTEPPNEHSSELTAWLVERYLEHLKLEVHIVPPRLSQAEREARAAQHQDLIEACLATRDAVAAAYQVREAPRFPGVSDPLPQIYASCHAPTGPWTNAALEWGLTETGPIGAPTDADLVFYAGIVLFDGWQFAAMSGSGDGTVGELEQWVSLFSDTSGLPEFTLLKKGEKKGRGPGQTQNDLLVRTWPVHAGADGSIDGDWLQRVGDEVLTTLMLCSQIGPPDSRR